MKRKITFICQVIFIVLVWLFSAWFHERDIVRNCIRDGKAGYSSWTSPEILCSEMKGKK